MATGRMSNMAENGAEAARHAFAETRESLNEAGEAVRKAARATAREAAEYGRDGANRAYGAAQTVGRSVSGYVSEKPVQAALIGLGGLLLVSMLLRRR